MKKLLFILSLVAILFSCNNSKKRTTKLFYLIPENTSLVIKINDLETFKNDIKNNDFINKLPSSDLQKEISKLLDNLKTNNPILVCLNNKTDYTIITKHHDSLFTISNADSLQIYSKIIDSIYVSSSSQIFLDNLKPNENLIFESIYKTTNSNSSFSIFANNKSAHLENSITLEGFDAFFNWMSLDVEISPDEITFNGHEITNDTVPRLLKAFKNTVPQENTIQHITPSNSNGFLSLTFDDFDLFYKNSRNFYGNSLESLSNYDLFQSINEVGEIYFDVETVVVLNSIDASDTKEALQDHQNEVSNFRTIPVFEYSNSEIFNAVFGSYINYEIRSYYTILDNFFVFANTIEQLQHIITNYQNGTTFANTNAFKDAMISLSDESSLLVFANSTKLKEIISSITNENSNNLKLNDYKASAIQFVQDDGFIHINGVIKKNKSRALQNSVSEEFNVTLDADIIMQPHFVTNHRSKQKEIVVQDVNNNLYLISNSGKVLWKKRLNGNILGQIEQVDLYKNGRLQLAFTTPKRIYIIDRNGNDVPPFPLKFNSEITQPLSIFDYDNNKNYRFLVTQGKFLLMYNKSAKNVSGFRYSNTGNNISTSPKHFRIGNKDYIVFASGKKMMILNRKGQSRIKVKEDIDFSGNSIFKYKDRFTTTSSTGELIQVNTKGAVSKQSLNLNKNHFVVTTDKTLVTLSENNLNIKQKTYELDFGNYTAPKIFYLNDKIYISLTDLQTQKVYLLDSQARLLNNFPVYGNSLIDLANIDNDNKLEFVVIGETNNIIVYKKN
ncbi:ribonuclease HII [Flavobacteriaceae bacterium AH-315-B10]|nr:ribonuclease HII [Flavobacteriaceae bacterium AH-315-B10]